MIKLKYLSPVFWGPLVSDYFFFNPFSPKRLTIPAKPTYSLLESSLYIPLFISLVLSVTPTTVSLLARELLSTTFLLPTHPTRWLIPWSSEFALLGPWAFYYCSFNLGLSLPMGWALNAYPWPLLQFAPLFTLFTLRHLGKTCWSGKGSSLKGALLRR